LSSILYLRENGTISFNQATAFENLHGDWHEFYAGQVVQAHVLDMFMHLNFDGDMFWFQTFPSYAFEGEFYETLNTESVMAYFYGWSEGTGYRALIYPIINFAVSVIGNG